MSHHITKKKTHFKPEITLSPLTPTVLPIEIIISSLLIITCNGLRVVRSLEPSQILLMEPPTLLFQFPSGEPLFVCASHIVEDVE